MWWARAIPETLGRRDQHVDAGRRIRLEREHEPALSLIADGAARRQAGRARSRPGARGQLRAVGIADEDLGAGVDLDPEGVPVVVLGERAEQTGQAPGDAAELAGSHP